MNKFTLLLAAAALVSVDASIAVADDKSVQAELNEGWKWNYEIVRSLYGSPDTDREEAWGFHFEGERVIGEKTYSVFKDGNGTEVAYMRTEESRIYLATLNADETYFFQIFGTEGQPVEEQEVLLYDFSCQVGDRFKTVGFDDVATWQGRVMEVEVTSVDEVFYGGASHTRMTYHELDSASYGTFSVTEGLGPEVGPLCFPQYANLTSGSHAYKTYYELKSLSDGEDTVLWEVSETIGLAEVSATAYDSTAIYDLQGRKVTNPERGVYVRGGKKVVVLR